MNRNAHRRIWVGSLFLCCVLVVPSARGQCTICVDADAPGPGNGSCWENPFIELQCGLGVAEPGDVICVAEGTYKPDYDCDTGQYTGDRTATFQLISGVEVYGGYAGWGEDDPDERDIALYETILSGDLAGDDGPDFANNDENSFHVVTGSGTDQTAVLDGVTITGGNADRGTYPDYVGGGMLGGGSATLTDCTFQDNSASHGGGIYGAGGSTLTRCTFTGNLATGGGGGIAGCGTATLTDCTFSGNLALYDGGGISHGETAAATLTGCTFSGNTAGHAGGGMHIVLSSPVLTNCTFIGNSAELGGALAAAFESSPTLTNCTFAGNQAGSEGIGGGMVVVWEGSPTLNNCTFTGNQAGVCGGGMDIAMNSTPTLTNCTFSGNQTDGDGGGISNQSGVNVILQECVLTGNYAGGYGAGMYSDYNSHAQLTNCTFSDNRADEGDGGGVYNGSDGSSTAANCILWGNCDQGGMDESAQISGPADIECGCIQGCSTHCEDPEECNFGDDPLFCDPRPCEDAPTTAGDYHLHGDSPCLPGQHPNGCDCGLIGALGCGCAPPMRPMPEDSLGTPCDDDSDCLNEATCIEGVCYVPKNRYISLRPMNAGSSVALKVTTPLCPLLEWWVLAPDPSDPPDVCRLWSVPHFQDWSTEPPVIHVGDADIVPRFTYEIRAILSGADIENPCNYSPPLTLPTVAVWGDIVGPSFAGSWTPPDGVVDEEHDLEAVIEYFMGEDTAPPLTRCDVAPYIPDAWVGLNDFSCMFGAIDGFPYPMPKPCPYRAMPEDCADIYPGDRCSSGPCTTDDDCAFESHCVPPPTDMPEGDGVCYAPKTRYLSIARHPEQVPNTGRRVMLQDGYCQDNPDFRCVTDQNCVDAGAAGPCVPDHVVLGWVGEPWEDGSDVHSDPYMMAEVVDSPVYQDTWPDVVHVHTCEIAHASLCDISGLHCRPNPCPGGETCVHHCYIVQAISGSGDINNEDDYSEELMLCTNTTWGDTCASGPGGLRTPPDGVHSVGDILAAIGYFQGETGIAPLTWLDIAPSTGDDYPDQVIGLADILGFVAGFQGEAYPGDGPLNCP